jgi:hypothetical protein
MTRDDKTSILIVAVVVLAMIVLTATVWVAGSHFEARAFNRVTGKDVTTWEAMFIELRVQEPTMEKGGTRGGE